MIKKKINELTNNMYKGFIVKKAEYNIAKNLLSVTLVFPEKYYHEIKKEDREVLKTTINDIVGKDINVRLQVEFSFADSYLIKNTVIKFIAKEEPLYASNISADDISVIAKETSITINLVLDSGTFGFFNSNGFTNQLKEYLGYQFTQDVFVKLIKDETKDSNINSQVIVSDNIFSARGTRTMVISEQEKLIGRSFLGAPTYIIDIMDNPKEQVVACGKVSNVRTKFIEKINKTKLDFILNDTTSSINVVKFDGSKNEEYKKLEDGMEVVVQGKASINSFNDKLQMIVNNISTCKIDYSKIDLEPVYNTANLYYLNVFPEPYVELSQTSLFDKVEPIPEYLKGKTFVAFDLETTGLSNKDKIIEIGAAKMVDGEITEIFNTLVNPEMPIPADASKVNNIFDEDVAGAFLIEDVFPDFYKFIEDFPIIAHNIDYDISYINQVAKSMNYKVKNEQLDTLKIAKKYLKQSKYNLGSLCKLYDIDIVNAHRACYDAVACLKLFKKLAIYL